MTTVSKTYTPKEMTINGKVYQAKPDHTLNTFKAQEKYAQRTWAFRDIALTKAWAEFD